MEKIETLIQILSLARKIGNQTIEKETASAIAVEYGLIPTIRYKSLSEIPLYTPLQGEAVSKIRAIKELRERAMENGLPYGLKESKEEIDRRVLALKQEAERARYGW